LLLLDKAGKTSAKLVNEDTGTELFLAGENGEHRIELSSNADGSAGLNFSDRNGVARASFGVTNADLPLLTFTDGHGNVTRLDPVANVGRKSPKAAAVSP
jgi:hypothetical protein